MTRNGRDPDLNILMTAIQDDRRKIYICRRHRAWHDVQLVRWKNPPPPTLHYVRRRPRPRPSVEARKGEQPMTKETIQ